MTYQNTSANAKWQGKCQNNDGKMMRCMECEKKSNMVVETTMERWGYMFSFIPFGVLGVKEHYSGHLYVVTLHFFPRWCVFGTKSCPY
jgi:hypothetical protein